MWLKIRKPLKGPEAAEITKNLEEKVRLQHFFPLAKWLKLKTCSEALGMPCDKAVTHPSPAVALQRHQGGCADSLGCWELGWWGFSEPHQDFELQNSVISAKSPVPLWAFRFFGLRVFFFFNGLWFACSLFSELWEQVCLFPQGLSVCSWETLLAKLSQIQKVAAALTAQPPLTSVVMDTFCSTFAALF